MRATHEGYPSRKLRLAVAIALAAIALTAVSEAGSLAQAATQASSADRLCFFGGSLPDIPVSGFSGDMAAADFDGDADIDLAVLSHHNHSVQIRLNNGNGTFTALGDVPTGQDPRDLEVGDLDGDSDLDLAVINQHDDDVTILLNNGDGTFSPGADVPLPAGDGGNEMALGDLDNDGDLDLVAPIVNVISIRFNNGNATFSSGTDLPSSYGNQAPEIADLDGDGDNDIGIFDRHNDRVEILLNNGLGMFSAGPKLPIPLGGVGLGVLEDLDGDGDIDVAVSSTGGLSVWMNNGSGTFSGGPFVAVDAGGPVAGDLDGDNDVDLVLIEGGLTDGAAVLLFNNGNATFTSGPTLAMGELPMSPVIADLNGDAQNDLAVLNMYDAQVTIRLNHGDGDFIGFSDVPVYQPSMMLVEDFSGNSYPDLAVESDPPVNDHPTLVIRPNNGDRTFDLTRPDIPVGDELGAMVAADFDGDSHMDLALAKWIDEEVAILLNNGDATFTARPDVPVGDAPRRMVAADLDGDSDIDLAVVSDFGPTTVSIRLNNGSGYFTAAPDIPAPGSQGLAAADIDGDADIDLIISRVGGDPAGPDYVSVMLNNGNATFAPGSETEVLKDTWKTIPADLDGDADIDLLVKNLSSDHIMEILLNTGAGSFVAGTAISFVYRISEIAVGDIDGDSDLDVAVGQDTGVAILLNNGDATFDKSHPDVPAAGDVGVVALADLDGDSDLDIAAVTRWEDSVAIRLNGGLCGNGGGANQAPTAVGDGPYPTLEDTPLAVPPPGVLGNDSDPDGDLIVSIPDTRPANGTLALDPTGSFTYSPDPDWCGTDSFTYHATDGEADSNIVSVAVDVECVIDPPVAQDDSATTPEDSAVTIDVLANDSDADDNLDPASVTVIAGPSHGSLSGGDGGIFTYLPSSDWSGADVFTYEVCDTDALCDTAEVTITVAPVNDPPVIGSISAQTVQYSDGIIPIAVNATDIDSMPLTFSASGLPEGLSLITTVCTAAGDGSACTTSVAGIATDPAGTYNATVTVSDGQGLAAAATVAITVIPEDATVRFPDVPNENDVAVQVASPGGVSETFALTVLVSERQPDTAIGTPYAGDISLANVSMALLPVGPGSSMSPTGPCDQITAGSGYEAVLTATCSFSAVPVNTYIVQVTIDGGYYTIGDDDTGTNEDVLVVYDPSLGFTTGGGWFYWPGTNDKTNFGYTMKYNQNGEKVQGSFLLIRHLEDGAKYRVKSNALYGLAIGGDSDFGWASFSGKATYLEPGWSEPIGNHEFVVYVEDLGEPGAGADRIWLEMHDKKGAVIAALSMARGAPVNAVTMNGGNLVVPH